VAAALACVGWVHIPKPAEAWIFLDAKVSHSPSSLTNNNKSLSITESIEFDCMRRRKALVIVSASISSLIVLPASSRNLPTSNGADTSKIGTVEALIPIARLRNDLKQLMTILEEENGNYQQPKSSKNAEFPQSASSSIASKFPAKEQDFKRLFDAYSDQVSYKQKFIDQNAFLVYYTQGYDGPGRKRIEEGDVENERQTLQFGARNEAWVAWESFLAEQEYYQKVAPSASASQEEREEAFAETIKCMLETIKAVDSYLDLAPKADLASAEKQLYASDFQLTKILSM
jgi:hypothetical protein